MSKVASIHKEKITPSKDSQVKRHVETLLMGDRYQRPRQPFQHSHAELYRRTGLWGYGKPPLCRSKVDLTSKSERGYVPCETDNAHLLTVLGSARIVTRLRSELVHYGNRNAIRPLDFRVVQAQSNDRSIGFQG